MNSSLEMRLYRPKNSLKKIRKKRRSIRSVSTGSIHTGVREEDQHTADESIHTQERISSGCKASMNTQPLGSPLIGNLNAWDRRHALTGHNRRLGRKLLPEMPCSHLLEATSSKIDSLSFLSAASNMTPSCGNPRYPVEKPQLQRSWGLVPSHMHTHTHTPPQTSLGYMSIHPTYICAAARTNKQGWKKSRLLCQKPICN